MVLTYHEVVAADSPYLYSVTRRTLEGHLNVLRDFQASSKSALQPNQVTFDDGHCSHYHHALPLLEKYGIRGTFYVTAGWSGVQPEYMTVAQLKDLVARGHRVQAHGWSHRMLTRCTPSQLHKELWHSKRVLEDWLGAAVDSISLPHGRWNDRVLEACAQAGYKDAYVSQPSIGLASRSGIRLMGRLMVTRKITSNALNALLRSKGAAARFFRAKDDVKSALRAAVGDALYHQFWRFIAADHQSAVDAPPVARSMQILHLISSEGYYGAESMLVNLAKSIEVMNSRSVIGVFCNSQNPHVEIAHRAKQQGLDVEVIPCNGRTDSVAIRAIQRIIYKYGVDIVHTHGFKPNLYALLAAPAGVGRIATYHLDWPDRSLLLYCYHLLDRLILRGFHKVVAVSDAIARSLRRAGLRRKKLTTIANGIDLAPYIEAASAPGSRPEGKTVIGVVGRLTPQKGHRYLLEAASRIVPAFPAVNFIFFGDGAERDNLKKMASSLGIEGNVVFAGQRSDMPAVYASIDILVLPSINEGMPMTLIEGLAARRPVIATAVGDVPKLIHHRETGLLVKAGDAEELEAAIRELLSDSAQRDRLAAQGQSWICGNFSAETMAQRYHEVYREALGQEQRLCR